MSAPVVDMPVGTSRFPVFAPADDAACLCVGSGKSLANRDHLATGFMIDCGKAVCECIGPTVAMGHKGVQNAFDAIHLRLVQACSEHTAIAPPEGSVKLNLVHFNSRCVSTGRCVITTDMETDFAKLKDGHSLILHLNDGEVLEVHYLGGHFYADSDQPSANPRFHAGNITQYAVGYEVVEAD